MSRKAMFGFATAAIIAIGLFVLYIFSKQIPRDPADVGNLAGNLHNKGLFFEMDGKVYFSNPYDHDCLYSMNPDESHPKRLTSMRAQYISGAHGFLYFYMDSTKKSDKVSGLGSVSNQYGIYRCKIDGSDQECLLRDFCGEVQLCGEYLYYQTKLNGGALNKIRVDKKEKQQVVPEMISPVCYDRGTIYYTGVSQDHYIHAMNTQAGDTTRDVLYGHLFFPVVMGNYIYYMNGDAGYSLWRANMYDGTTEVVINERLDNYTMDNNYIYYTYSNGLDSQLRRCTLDGENKTILFEGVTNCLNVTSHFLYFKVYGNDDVMYHMPLDGSNQISVLTFD